MRTWLIAVCASCSAPPNPPTTPAPEPRPGPRPPATFAKLFQQGTRWTFPTTVVTSERDDNTDEMKETKTTGSLTCEITSVDTMADGSWRSSLTCTATPKLPTQIPTRFVATSKGLAEWYEGQGPSGMLIDHPPRVRSDHQDHPENEGSMGSGVSNDGSRWCFGKSQAIQGYSSDWSLCLRDGDFVGGKSHGNHEGYVTIRWGDAED